LYHVVIRLSESIIKGISSGGYKDAARNAAGPGPISVGRRFCLQEMFAKGVEALIDKGKVAFLVLLVFE